MSLEELYSNFNVYIMYTLIHTSISINDMYIYIFVQIHIYYQVIV